MDIQKYLYITISKDKMIAKIHCTDDFDDMKQKLDEKSFIYFLMDYKITHGISKEAITSILEATDTEKFPIIIAKGAFPQDGKDGAITYEFDYDTSVGKFKRWNFRDVMRIPTVKKGEKLASITKPTSGKDGVNIYGKVLIAKKGKPVQMIAGKNVEFKEAGFAYYSTAEGQVGIRSRFIEVHDTYEVHEDLSMKTGNIDFVGTVIIHGDVPAGYKVKAGGDIKIFGIVEAAEVIAGGSVFISEGLSGMKKGRIEANENVYIGYINQGIIVAKNNLYVENSIIHSEVKSYNSVLSQRGNIIGGTITIGNAVEAKDIGNRLSTETTIHFLKDENLKEQTTLLKRKEKLEDTLSKLKMIGKQLQKEKDQDAKLRVTILRQRNSEQKVIQQIIELDRHLLELKEKKEDNNQPYLIVRNHLYMSVIITFGRYKHKVEKVHHQVKVLLKHNEVSVKSYKMSY